MTENVLTWLDHGAKKQTHGAICFTICITRKESWYLINNSTKQSNPSSLLRTHYFLTDTGCTHLCKSLSSLEKVLMTARPLIQNSYKYFSTKRYILRRHYGLDVCTKSCSWTELSLSSGLSRCVFDSTHNQGSKSTMKEDSMHSMSIFSFSQSCSRRLPLLMRKKISQTLFQMLLNRRATFQVQQTLQGECKLILFWMFDLVRKCSLAVALYQ